MPSGRHVKTMDELYPLLGRLVVEWGGLEFWLCQIMRGLLGLSAFEANAIFYSAVNNQTRFELLQRTITVKLSGDAPEIAAKRQAAKALVEKARALNKTRNRFLHATYVGPGNGAVLMADMGDLRHDPERDGMTVSGTQVGWADIKNHSDAVSDLSGHILEFVRDQLGLTQL